MKEIKDIDGNTLNIGDTVLYARKNPYSANGILVKGKIKTIKGNIVLIRSINNTTLRSTRPGRQIFKLD